MAKEIKKMSKYKLNESYLPEGEHLEINLKSPGQSVKRKRRWDWLDIVAAIVLAVILYVVLK